MSDSGPTTAGSIIGKLSIDREQWIRDSAATKADAKELGDLDPTIHVKANVGDALAELESLKAAQAGIGGNVAGPTVGGSAATDAASAASTRLAATSAKTAAALEAVDAAQDKVSAAAGRYNVAQLRVIELDDKSRVSASQEASVRLAATSAYRAQETAAAKLVLAKQALVNAAHNEALAEVEASAAAEENAVAQDSQAKATDNTGKSMGRLQAIFTAVVALGPGLIPIAGWAVGAGGALTAMLGVGVLAVLGIRNELKQGGEDANAFAAGLAGLKGDLGQLEATASHGVLAGFQSVVAQIDADMPNLNAETDMYARLLGSIASTSTEGLLGGWKQLSPLVADVASYLVAVDQRLASFAMSPQFAAFVSYAEQNLPRVEDLLNSLVATAFHLLAAFAPWGGLVVDVLTDVSNVISAIPTPVLATLIELALGGSLAFKAWTSIPVMLASVATTIGAVTVAEDGATVATGALGAAIDFMEGPIGWVIAGLGALAAVVLVTASAQNKGADSAASYASAVALDNGVIGENIKLQAAKNLTDSGAIANAEDLGIKTNDLVKAALGNKAANESVTATLTKAKKANDDQQQSYLSGARVATAYGNAVGEQRDKIDSVTSSLTTNQGAIKAGIKAFNDMQKAIGGTTISTEAQLVAQQGLANTYGVSLSVYEGAVAAQKKTADQAKATTLQLQLENDAASLLTNAFTLLNGGSLSLASAQTGLASSNNSVVASLKQNKTVIDGNSAAAVANQQAIQSQVQAAQQEAEAVGKATGSSKQATAAYKASEAALLAQMQAAHLLTPALQTYIDKLYDIKNLHIPRTKLDVDTAAALIKIQILKASLASIKSRSVAVDLNGSASGTGHYGTFATGGTIPGLAAGGSGTVRGAGTSTSDSNLFALSVGEEVIRTSRANTYRPFLKAINNGNPRDIQNAAKALAPATPPQNNVRTQNVTLVVNNPISRDPAQEVRARAQDALSILQAGGL